MKRINKVLFPFAACALLSLVGGCDAGSTLNDGITPPPPSPDAAVNTVDAAPPVVDAAIVARTVPEGRFTTSLQSLYIFEEPLTPSLIVDHSGLATPYNLTIDNNAAVSFGPDGMTITESMLATNPAPHTSLMNACQNSNAITVEAWAKSDVLTPEERGRVVSLSVDGGNRNFDLANNEAGIWDARLRTDDTGNNGTNPSTPAVIDSVSGEMQHIVYTHLRGANTNRGTIYLDGAKSGLDQNITGTYGNWNLDYALNVGNEATNNRPFIGTIALVAVYCRALTPAEVTQNYEAGYL